MKQKQSAYSFESLIGGIAIIWENFNGEDKIVRIILKARIGKHNSQHIPTSVKRLSEMIKSSLQGEEITFPLEFLYFEGFTEFQKRVLLCQYSIKKGSITTYGKIAESLGKPRATRAVGNALSMNPYPIVIPCHRTVRSNGELGGFRYGQNMKRRLLQMEGIKFTPNGRAIFPETDKYVS